MHTLLRRGGGTPDNFLIQCRTHSMGRRDSKKRVCVEGGSSGLTYHDAIKRKYLFHIFFGSTPNLIFRNAPKMMKNLKNYKIQCPTMETCSGDRTSEPHDKYSICYVMNTTNGPSERCNIDIQHTIFAFLRRLEHF